MTNDCTSIILYTNFQKRSGKKTSICILHMSIHQTQLIMTLYSRLKKTSFKIAMFSGSDTLYFKQ